ncbi:hypothetical protein RD792_000330, partial [Penstemon davidsonii]
RTRYNQKLTDDDQRASQWQRWLILSGLLNVASLTYGHIRDLKCGDISIHRANKLSKALVLFGDVEANDITYSLIQKKSIQKVQSYIPHVKKAQINAAR